MQKYSVILTDDIDPEVEADESIRFGLDGVSFTIDLSEEHAAEFRAALTPYLNAARRVASDVATGRKRTPASVKRSDLNDIREWANAMGEKVSSRGRIPASIVEAYDKAH